MSNFADLINATGGKIFSVEITKKNGTKRRITARLSSHLPDVIDLSFNQIRVIDMHASRATGATQYRTIRLDHANHLHFKEKNHRRIQSRPSSATFNRANFS